MLTCLALFGVLITPLNALPWCLNGAVEALVSVRRLRDYLSLPERRGGWAEGALQEEAPGRTSKGPPPGVGSGLLRGRAALGGRAGRGKDKQGAQAGEEEREEVHEEEEQRGLLAASGLEDSGHAQQGQAGQEPGIGVRRVRDAAVSFEGASFAWRRVSRSQARPLHSARSHVHTACTMNDF